MIVVVLDAARVVGLPGDVPPNNGPTKSEGEGDEGPEEEHLEREGGSERRGEKRWREVAQ